MRKAQAGLFLLILLGCSDTLPALPRIFPNGIVNGAGFVRPGLPGGKIARGSIFSIFGSDLGPEAGAEVSSFPLRTSLAGVSVKVTQGETSVDAIPLFVRDGQINAIMPSDAPLGRVSRKGDHVRHHHPTRSWPSGKSASSHLG